MVFGKINGNFCAYSIAVLIIVLGYIYGAGNINEQYPSGGFTPKDGGEGGNCEELHKKNPLEKFLQPNDVDTGRYDYYNVPKSYNDGDGTNLCTRECKPDDPGKICYYKFDVDRFVTMGLPCRNCLVGNNFADCDLPHCIPADGYEKMVVVVNHRMPGPSIQVCQNDLIVVDVKNNMPGTGITIHWHGITQLGTPYMDGVPMLTQCPIMENQIFRYVFQPSNPGLFFWHSHDGLQKIDGFVGSLVVRRPDIQEPYGYLYDYDLPSHVMVIQDWMHETADAVFPGLRSRRVGQHPDTYLINGRGRYKTNGVENAAKLSVFRVRRSFNYVFRVISGTCLACPIRVQIEDHTMTIIGVDGRDTEPREVDSIVMGAGERYKVIVRAKPNPGKFAYWITVTAAGFCEEDNITSRAILRYDIPANGQTMQRLEGPLPSNQRFGEVNAKCDGSDNLGLCYKDLVGVETAPIGIRQQRATYRMIVGLEFYLFNNNLNEAFPPNQYPDNEYKISTNPTGTGPVASMINGIVNTMTPVPLLSQYYEVPDCLYCSSRNPFSRWYDHKQCLHVYRVDYPAIVEIIILDLGKSGNKPNSMSHPMHLHGYDQYLVDQGVFRTVDIERELTNLLANLDSQRIKVPEKPIMKDTFLVPGGGYIVLRIIADNPGFWFMHCHFAYHQEGGMSAILQVGSPDDQPDVPDNFPTCRNFLTMPSGMPQQGAPNS